MKKALSLFLAVLMIFATLSVGASAEPETTTGPSSLYPTPYHGPEGSGRPATLEQTVFRFDPNAGKFKTQVIVYDTDTGEKKAVDNYAEKWVMLPPDTASFKPGQMITLPLVTAPSGRQFDGWFCYYDRQTYAANSFYYIPEGTAGTMIEFVAAYSPAEEEVDTMQKVLGILMKVFGAIIGIVFYAGDTEAGLALMEKVFAGVLG